MPFVSIEKVTKIYHANGDSAEVRVLSDVSAEIAEGEFVCLMGPSGSGRSTLLTIVGRDESSDRRTRAC